MSEIFFFVLAMCKQLAEKLTRTMTERQDRETKRSPHLEGLGQRRNRGNDHSGPVAWLRASRVFF